MLGTVTEDEYGVVGAQQGDVASSTYTNILKEMQSKGSKSFRIQTKTDGKKWGLKMWGPDARTHGDKTTSKEKEKNPWKKQVLLYIKKKKFAALRQAYNHSEEIVP